MAKFADEYYVLNYISSLNRKVKISKNPPLYFLLKIWSLVSLLMPSEIFLSYLSPRPALSVALSTSACIVNIERIGNWDKWARTAVNLLVGEVLGGLVALEGVFGLVHESRHVCGF